ncbi:hypothetical protein [Deinococcus yavapaiensis]|uniref:Uncharacterized protein n=1 Tax=Deinococcus yavapaiensis KR-236 TaxID=694435 RepID=A0A318SA34_9DEIO|nr:hypothetical protein [Deinococcus yavapaiensis]PYE53094.1 hypothetical protein DES52_11077 [Deinococcus yavapaiensis KR-236]
MKRFVDTAVPAQIRVLDARGAFTLASSLGSAAARLASPTS